MAIELIDKIKPKNNGSFPLIDASDVVMGDGTRLDEKIEYVNNGIPTKTSQLENDSGYLTQHQDISGKADKATTLAGYGITDGATKEEVKQFSEEIVDLQTALVGVSELIGGEE